MVTFRTYEERLCFSMCLIYSVDLCIYNYEATEFNPVKLHQKEKYLMDREEAAFPEFQRILNGM